MSCPNFQELSAYLDGELPEEPSRKVERHLRECPGCRSCLDDWSRMRKRLVELPVPGESGTRIFMNLHSRRPSRTVHVPFPVAAAGVIALAVSLVLNVILLVGMGSPTEGGASQAGQTIEAGSAEVYPLGASQDPKLEELLEEYRLRSTVTVVVRETPRTDLPEVVHEDK